MATWVALFRGINVGGKNILRMQDLVAQCHGLNFAHVRTYIQSGNLVFDSPRRSAKRLAVDLASSVERNNGFRPRVFVLAVKDFESVLAQNPFPAGEADPKSLHLFFLEAAASDADMDAFLAVRGPNEKFQLTEECFYLYAPDGVGRSKLAAKAEQYLGVAATARNWRTLTKLRELAR